MKYLSVTETAKLIRKQLKAKFPETKFSVRSSSYSMGASINVSWTDGPRADEVDPMLAGFKGERFDGMIDMGYSVESWLLPDGSAAPGKSEGTQMSMGSHPGYDNEKPHPDAEMVSFGADFVFTERSLSPEAKAKVVEALEKDLEIEPGSFDGDTRYTLPNSYQGNEESGYVLLHQKGLHTGAFSHEHPDRIADEKRWAAEYEAKLAEEGVGAA